MTIFMSYSRANEDAVKTRARAFEEARREVADDQRPVCLGRGRPAGSAGGAPWPALIRTVPAHSSVRNACPERNA